MVEVSIRGQETVFQSGRESALPFSACPVGWEVPTHPGGGMACFPQSPGNTLTDIPTDNVTKYLGPLVVRSRGHLQSTFTVTEVAGVGLGALWENSTAVGLPSLASLICEMGWWHLPHGVVG